MTLNEKFYRELRCPNCHRLLGHEYIFAGRLAIFCRSCEELCEFSFKHPKTKENMDTIDKEFTVSNPETETREGVKK